MGEEGLSGVEDEIEGDAGGTASARPVEECRRKPDPPPDPAAPPAPPPAAKADTFPKVQRAVAEPQDPSVKAGVGSCRSRDQEGVGGAERHREPLPTALLRVKGRPPGMEGKGSGRKSAGHKMGNPF